MQQEAIEVERLTTREAKHLKKVLLERELRGIVDGCTQRRVRERRE